MGIKGKNKHKNRFFKRGKKKQRNQHTTRRVTVSTIHRSFKQTNYKSPILKIGHSRNQNEKRKKIDKEKTNYQIEP